MELKAKLAHLGWRIVEKGAGQTEGHVFSDAFCVLPRKCFSLDPKQHESFQTFVYAGGLFARCTVVSAYTLLEVTVPSSAGGKTISARLCRRAWIVF
jgi:hypothetical protein